MKFETEKIEIMAPAGSMAALSAAIRSGANSIYFGIDQLNMRSRAASPFTILDLKKIARICRMANVKSYLALNTLIYDEDLESMKEVCDAAKAANLSAVIATDISTIEYARSIDLEVHISVQANVSNTESVRFYSRYADVVVLARELTLEQISNIHKFIVKNQIKGPSGNLIQLEAFVHGALCVAISGKCYMSLAQYNQSANRGACFQPCRRKYNVTDVQTGKELEIDNQYIMSPRDICLIDHLNLLVEAGISVFKIEGRGRPADYVNIVVDSYVRALEAHASGTYSEELSAELVEKMRTVFNRNFWMGGYYCGTKLGEWSEFDNTLATKQRVMVGTVSNYFSKIGVAEFELIQKDLTLPCELLFEGSTTGAVHVLPEDIRVNGGEPTQSAVKGDKITVSTDGTKVRRLDKVFVLVES
ncbi:MAG: U32 family peptidase [Kiritimatiellae bacterium]|jgi:putative protease|nr:U32 family peptidase [Kiritimatiellia bacterium]